MLQEKYCPLSHFKNKESYSLWLYIQIKARDQVQPEGLCCMEMNLFVPSSVELVQLFCDTLESH